MNCWKFDRFENGNILSTFWGFPVSLYIHVARLPTSKIFDTPNRWFWFSWFPCPVKHHGHTLHSIDDKLMIYLTINACHVQVLVLSYSIDVGWTLSYNFAVRNAANYDIPMFWKLFRSPLIVFEYIYIFTDEWPSIPCIKNHMKYTHARNIYIYIYIYIYFLTDIRTDYFILSHWPHFIVNNIHTWALLLCSSHGICCPIPVLGLVSI